MKLGVIGAGIMGTELAYVAASRGINVTLIDLSEEVLEKAIDHILKLSSRRKQEVEVLRRIRTSTLLESLNDVDMVVEAIVENKDIKRETFKKLDKITKDSCVIASNTSSISIKLLEDSIANPSKFVGYHVFNPVSKMPLVEIIKGTHTSKETINTALALTNKMGKNPIIVNDCPGFLVNRILFAYLVPAIDYLDEGVDYVALDKIAKDYGWPMGPYTLIDTIGIDISIHAGTITVDGYDHMTMPSMKTLTKLFDEGHLGGKSETGGIYKNVEPGKKKATEKMFNHMIDSFFKEIQMCIDEGIVGSMEEARIACIFGLGYPPYKKFGNKTDTSYIYASMV